jgi:uncharacterized membrane protein/nitrite reductase/ring-hydroxylating ferredoxin subunit
MRSAARISSHPIHPMLVSFPIGLWVTAFIFDLIGVAADRGEFTTAAFYMAIAGCVGALFAAVAGALDWYSVVPPNSSGKKRGITHGLLNTTVLVLFIVALTRRGNASAAPDNVTLLIEVIAVAILGYSGWLGGTLVYRNQIGVDHRYANAGKWKERTLDSFDRPVCNTNELGMGQMMLAHIEGERIAVGRCETGIVAFHDHCTHRGGPLSDGVLIGCTVQCPWHGSNFDVNTGRVVAGPAEQKIKTYQIEIRANEVYVRRDISEEQRRAA